MQTYCVGCHYTGAKAVGGITLDNFNDVVTAATDSAVLLGTMRHTPGYNPMPQTGTQLSDCQVTQIEKWIKNGMQND
jgi:mono/diheme cytochrome c family protein